MLAFALAVAVGAGDPGRTLPLLAGVAVLLVVGTIDDRRTVTPQLRVAVELAVGVLLTAAGLGWRLGAGFAVDAAVTGIWVVAVVNSFNLFDNMDGAASTMAAVVSGGACVLAISTGATWAAVGCAALAGACLGFLPHNLAKPAKIFLGDGGSMPLGFAVAALVASAARSAEPSTLALLVGFLLVGIPAVDTCLVIVSRRRRGISVLTGGQDHLTHRTRRGVQDDGAGRTRSRCRAGTSERACDRRDPRNQRHHRLRVARVRRLCVGDDRHARTGGRASADSATRTPVGRGTSRGLRGDRRRRHALGDTRFRPAPSPGIEYRSCCSDSSGSARDSARYLRRTTAPGCGYRSASDWWSSQQSRWSPAHRGSAAPRSSRSARLRVLASGRGLEHVVTHRGAGDDRREQMACLRGNAAVGAGPDP